MTDYKPGDVIPVRVGTVIIDTTIDKGGVQRFPEDPILGAWVDGTSAATDAYNKRRSVSGWKVENSAGERYEDENFNLNHMARLRRQGRFTDEEWLNFYLHIGYSVSGFSDLSDFSHLEIVNPAWGDPVEKVYAYPDENYEKRFSAADIFESLTEEDFKNV